MSSIIGIFDVGGPLVIRATSPDNLSRVHDRSKLSWYDGKVAYALLVTVVALAVAILAFEGRVWWCPAGDHLPWSWQVLSRHNSQHLIDPYSFTHILHGMIEFFLIGLIFRKIPLGWKLLFAVSVESIWEIAENSPMIIERYRAATISLDYYGDSILNSVSDITCCSLGFWIASQLGFWRSALVFSLTEIVLALCIHDSLLLNILMLVYPLEAVKQWQMAL